MLNKSKNILRKKVLVCSKGLKWAPSNTLRLFPQNVCNFFFNIHDKCILYQGQVNGRRSKMVLVCISHLLRSQCFQNGSIHGKCMNKMKLSFLLHCEILGSYLQQHHQHPIFRAYFHAEPQGQAQTKKVDRLYIPNSGSELTVSGLTDITASICCAM